MESGLKVKKNIEDIIFDSMGVKISINDRYHHNSSYASAPSIIKNGILSLHDLHRNGIVNFSDSQLKIFDDTDSHVNGSDRVSLAVVGLDDLYKDEVEFNPFKPANVDFIVSSNIKASRNSTHYGNEFLSYGSIKNDMLRSVDVRILEYLDRLSKLETTNVNDLINIYESLRNIAIALKESKLDIPLREMSKGNSLDIDKIIEMPKLVK